MQLRRRNVRLHMVIGRNRFPALKTVQCKWPILGLDVYRSFKISPREQLNSLAGKHMAPQAVSLDFYTFQLLSV